MKSTSEKLENIKQYGYKLDFGEVFELAFQNYKKIALTAGFIMLVLVIVFTVIVGGFAGVVLGLASITSYFTNYNPAEFSSSTIVVSFVAGIIGAAIMAPLTAGLLKIAHNAETNKDFGFSTAFEYYKSSQVKELIMAAMIITLFSSGIVTAIELSKEYYVEDSTLTIIAGTISFIINVFTPFFTLLTIPLIAFGNLKAIDAIQGSCLLVWKKFWVILLLLIVGFIFSFLGLIGFCLGIFFTLPIFYSLEYIVYRTAIGIDDVNEMDEIGNSEY